MEQRFVIQWRSRVNGRTGRGTKCFNREEGDRLVHDLNSEYPEIEHALVAAPVPDTVLSHELKEAH